MAKMGTQNTDCINLTSILKWSTDEFCIDFPLTTVDIQARIEVVKDLEMLPLTEHVMKMETELRDAGRSELNINTIILDKHAGDEDVSYVNEAKADYGEVSGKFYVANATDHVYTVIPQARKQNRVRRKTGMLSMVLMAISSIAILMSLIADIAALKTAPRTAISNPACMVHMLSMCGNAIAEMGTWLDANMDTNTSTETIEKSTTETIFHGDSVKVVGHKKMKRHSFVGSSKYPEENQRERTKQAAMLVDDNHPEPYTNKTFNNHQYLSTSNVLLYMAIAFTLGIIVGFILPPIFQYLCPWVSYLNCRNGCLGIVFQSIMSCLVLILAWVHRIISCLRNKLGRASNVGAGNQRSSEDSSEIPPVKTAHLRQPVSNKLEKNVRYRHT